MWENMKGLLALPEDPNQRAAAKQGLLGFGAALLGGRGDFGGILGDGLMAGSQGYHGALQQQQQQQLMATQQKRWDLENQQTQAGLDRQKMVSGVFSELSAPAAQGAPAPVAASPAGVPGVGRSPIAGLPQKGQPTAQNMKQRAYDEALRYAAGLMDRGLTAEAQPYLKIMEQLSPKLKEQRALTVDGRRVMVNVYEDGRTEQVEGFAPDAEKLNFQNTGGSTVALDPYTGKPVSTIQNTQSPDSVASVAATMRGQNMSDARARDLNEITRQGQRSQIINDPTQGPIVVDKGTAQARQVMLDGRAVPGEATAKREAAGRNLLPLIAQAEKLIDGATGSYLGAGADQGARFLGVATDGAQSIAQLKVLEGNIMMAQPRMEGPQSNLDVDLYRQMAAQIGDPTVPNATKKAALRTIKSLYAKYDSSAPPKVKSIGELPKKPQVGIPAGWTVKEK